MAAVAPAAVHPLVEPLQALLGARRCVLSACADGAQTLAA
jgi:hypothetical protein